jgi:hypothetical protein
MTLSPPVSRLLAFGLAAFAALILWAGIASPLIALYQDRAETLAEHADLLARLTGIAAEAPRLHALAESRHGTSAGGTPTLDGATDALAAATLQGLVQQIAGETGASIASVEGVPAAPAGPLRRIGLRVRLSADYPGLVQILLRIRLATPAMLIDDFTVSTGAAGMAGQIDAGFTLYAFRKGDGRA